MKLSPTTSYYIRKLLRESAQQLKTVVAPGAGMRADALSDLNAVLQSLYLEGSEIRAVVEQLEGLVSLHRALDVTSAFQRDYAPQLAEVEAQIFWLLGFKKAKSISCHDRSSLRQ